MGDFIEGFNAGTQAAAAHISLLYNALDKIKNYQDTDRLRKHSEKDWGLDYESALKMAYDNMKSEANYALKLHKKKIPCTYL